MLCSLISRKRGRRAQGNVCSDGGGRGEGLSGLPSVIPTAAAGATRQHRRLAVATVLVSGSDSGWPGSSGGRSDDSTFGCPFYHISSTPSSVFELVEPGLGNGQF